MAGSRARRGGDGVGVGIDVGVDDKGNGVVVSIRPSSGLAVPAADDCRTWV